MPILGDIIERNARHRPHWLALVYADQRVSHAEYALRVRKLASALHARGLRRGDRVSILAMNCSAYLETYGACEWAGYVLNTVNFRLAIPEIVAIMKDSDPKIVLFEQQYADAIGALRDEVTGVETYICIDAASEGAESYDAVLESGGRR